MVSAPTLDLTTSLDQIRIITQTVPIYMNTAGAHANHNKFNWSRIPFDILFNSASSSTVQNMTKPNIMRRHCPPIHWLQTYNGLQNYK